MRNRSINMQSAVEQLTSLDGNINVNTSGAYTQRSSQDVIKTSARRKVAGTVVNTHGQLPALKHVGELIPSRKLEPYSNTLKKKTHAEVVKQSNPLDAGYLNLRIKSSKALPPDEIGMIEELVNKVKPRKE